MFGDARFISSIGNSEVDAVLTSPPYLNAIDYMRGHRLSLVWLGYNLCALRQVRATRSVPNEVPIMLMRATFLTKSADRFCASIASVRDADPWSFGMQRTFTVLCPRLLGCCDRTGRAILVIGNSCLQGTFIRNSAGVIRAAWMVGLRLVHQVERELPSSSRYLPLPLDHHKPLGKRMRTEIVLTFRPA